MKETPQERLDRKKRELEEKKASKRSKKRRRRREEDARESRPSKHYRSSSSSSSSSSYDDDDDKPRRSRKGKERAKDDIDEDSDSYVPPRPSKDRPYVPYTFDDDDAESRIPSASSYKPDRAREEEEFNQKLFDAMREDEGGLDPFSEAGRYSGFSYDYREADPSVGNGAFGRTGVRDDRFVDPVSGVVLNRVIFKDAMNDEEYAEHVRRGMFRRTRKEEIAREEEYQRQQALKEKKRLETMARVKAMEEERQRKLEERARHKAAASVKQTREAYQASWARLVASDTAKDQDLRVEDFPWPVDQGRAGKLDAEGVRDFLTKHLRYSDEDLDDDARRKKEKMAIRTAVLAYHPDRFDKYVRRVKGESQRESVREMGLRVSQVLNEILGGL